MKKDQKIEENGQLILPIMHVEVQKTDDEIEMGVLENGMPYLSQRGLVKMAGISRTSFQNFTTNWSEEKKYGIGLAINNLLLSRSLTERPCSKQLFKKESSTRRKKS